MKVSSMLLLLPFLLVNAAYAFTTSPALVHRSRTLQVALALKETAAEAYLNQCLNEWELLEKELVHLKAHAKVSQDEHVRSG